MIMASQGLRRRVWRKLALATMLASAVSGLPVAASGQAIVAGATVAPGVTLPAVSGVAADRLAALVASNLALSPENMAPATFRTPVSLADPDVVAAARAQSDKAGHGGLHYNYYLFRAAIAKVHRLNADYLDIPAGTYRIYQPLDMAKGTGIVDLSHLSHVVVDGHGANLLFYYYGKAIAPLISVVARAAVRLSGSDHVVLRNLVIDWDEPLVVPITIGEQNGRQAMFVDPAFPVDPGSPLPITSFGQYDIARRSFQISRFVSQGDRDALHQLMSPGGQAPWTCTTHTSDGQPTPCYNYVGNQTYLFGPTEHFRPVPPSAWNFTARVRDNNFGAVIIDGRASFITVDNVTIYSAPGLGLGIIGAGPAMHINNVHIKRKPDALLRPGEPKRLMSTTADGINVLTSGGDVVIENSEVSNQADDGINIRSLMSPYKATAPFALDTPQTLDKSYMPVGSTVDLFDDRAQNLLAAKVQVTDVQFRPATHTYSVTLAPTIAPLVPGKTYRVRVRNTDSARVIVRNSRFGNNSERGVVVHGSDIAVVNNVFEQTAESAVQVVYDNRTGNPEGPPAENLIVAGNYIHDANCQWFDPALRSIAPPAAIAVYNEARHGFVADMGLAPGTAMASHLVISDNIIDYVAGAGIVVSQAKDVVLERNRVTNANQTTYGLPLIDGHGIVVEQTSNLQRAENAANAMLVRP